VVLFLEFQTQLPSSLRLAHFSLYICTTSRGKLEVWQQLPDSSLAVEPMAPMGASIVAGVAPPCLFKKSAAMVENAFSH
jgi:hypothetical protein